jgi:hypothetical protein
MMVPGFHLFFYCHRPSARKEIVLVIEFKQKDPPERFMCVLHELSLWVTATNIALVNAF